MKTVRLLYKASGLQARSSFAAGDVSEDNRDILKMLFDYACRNPQCGARFHYRGDIRPRGNGAVLPKTFMRNADTEHLQDCRYKPKPLVIQTRNYIDDESLHLRLNFPIGNTLDDRLPQQTAQEFYRSLQRHPQTTTMKTPVSHLRAMVDMIEKNYGGLENLPAGADVQHQENIRSWRDMFIASDRYDALFQQTYGGSVDDERLPLLVVMKPDHEITRNENGKRRFAGEAQYIRLDKTEHALRPVIVCENDKMAEYISRICATDTALLVATKPHPAQKYLHQKDGIHVYLDVREPTQLARIDAKKYWRYAPSAKHQSDFFARLER